MEATKLTARSYLGQRRGESAHQDETVCECFPCSSAGEKRARTRRTNAAEADRAPTHAAAGTMSAGRLRLCSFLNFSGAKFESHTLKPHAATLVGDV